MKKFILPLLLATGVLYAQYYTGPDTRNQPKPEEAYPPQEIPAAELPPLDQEPAAAAPSPLDEETAPGEAAPLPDAYEPAYPSNAEASPVQEVTEIPAVNYEDYGYEDYEPALSAPRPEVYPDLDPNKVKGIIIQLPFTNITITPPIAPYQTYDTSRLKSGRIPDMLSGKGLLQNLNQTSWRLKFYNHPDSQHVESLMLDIKDNDVSVTTALKGGLQTNIAIAPAIRAQGTNGAPALQLTLTEKEQSAHTYRLTLVKSLRPGEGIYAYDAGQGEINFMYLRLLMPHLLAFDMAMTYDEIALCPDKSLTDVGVFTLE